MSSQTQITKPRLSQLELYQWKEKVAKGFEVNEIISLDHRYINSIMMSSKGNVAIATPHHLFIVTNLPWQQFQEFLDSVVAKHDAVLSRANVILKIIKSEPQRKFSLAEALRFELTYSFTRSSEDFVIEKENERIEIEGAEFTVSEGSRRFFQEQGEIVVFWNSRARRYEYRVNIVNKVKVREEKEQTVVWRILDKSKPLGSLLSRAQDVIKKPRSSMWFMFIADSVAGIVDAIGGRISVNSFIRIDMPSEDELLSCSRFYTIFIPRIYMEEDNRRIIIYDMYYHGKKHRIVFSGRDLSDSVTRKLVFRILRNRFSISSYAKKVLPRGIISVRDLISDKYLRSFFGLTDLAKKPDYVNMWTKYVREVIIPKVNKLHSEPRILDPLSSFIEAFYVNAPLRKINNVVKRWIEIYDKVKDLAPKSTLYIVFYGRKSDPNYVGFKIDKDGTISVLPNRYVPVSGITMKGGEFEILYREAYVKKLFEYQIVPKSEKLEILWSDIVEVRDMLRNLGVEPATASLAEARAKIMSIAENYNGDNIILLFFKYLDQLKLFKPRDVDLNNVATLLIGLIKTGARDEMQKLLQYNALRVLRTVVKYEMKRRGYNIRKGVMFLGDPEQVKQRILEVIKGLRGRLYALAESLEIPVESVEELGIASSLRRVEALLGF